MTPNEDAMILLPRIYGAYGESTASGRARSSYAGDVAEAGTGWHLLGGRPYSPVLRRFLAPDTESPFDEGGLNRYAYCSGDPINRIDPTGESWISWLVAGVALVGATVATVVTAGAAAAAFAPAVMTAASSIGIGAVTAGTVGAASAGVTMGSVAAASAAAVTVAVGTPGIAAATAVALVNAAFLVTEVGSLASMAAQNAKAQETFGILQFGFSIFMGALGAYSSKPNSGLKGSGTPGGAPSGPRRTVPLPDVARSRSNTIQSGEANRRASSLSAGSVVATVTSSTDASRADVAQWIVDARAAGAGTLVVHTGANDTGQRRGSSQSRQGNGRGPSTELGDEAAGLGSSAGMNVTVTNSTGATAGRLGRELSWAGVNVSLFFTALDAATATWLGIQTILSSHVATRASF